MVTFHYQAKADTLPGYLSEHGYSERYILFSAMGCPKLGFRGA